MKQKTNYLWKKQIKTKLGERVQFNKKYLCNKFGKIKISMKIFLTMKIWQMKNVKLQILNFVKRPFSIFFNFAPIYFCFLWNFWFLCDIFGNKAKSILKHTFCCPTIQNTTWSFSKSWQKVAKICYFEFYQTHFWQKT